jgi:hypothetical protein
MVYADARGGHFLRRRNEPIIPLRTLTDELSPRDRELLEGMCNCHSVCGEGFEETVRMVASARGRTSDDVKETLARVAKVHSDDSDYALLRSRLPRDFPF